MDLKTVRKAAASATGLHGAFSGKAEEASVVDLPQEALSPEDEDRKQQAILDRAVMAQRAAFNEEPSRDRASTATSRGGRGGRGGREGRGGKRGSTAGVLVPRMPDEIREARSKTPTRNQSPPRPPQEGAGSSQRALPKPPPKPANRASSPPPKPPRPPPKPVRPFEYGTADSIIPASETPALPANPALEAIEEPRTEPGVKPALTRKSSAELGRALLVGAFVSPEAEGTG